MDNTFFQIKNVNKTFGGLKALHEVNLTVEQGTIHAIIGPNGAGKSTLLNCCIGKLYPDTGSVTFEGENLIGKSAHEINQVGIARVFQTPEIFPELSLIENVMIPAFAKRDGQFKLNCFKSVHHEEAIYNEVTTILENFGLKEQMKHHAGKMSRGDKRRLELAMCLIQHPRLLLLDEPTAGMARHDTNRTIDTLKKIKESGMTKIIIEHDMHVVFSLADKISVLAQGAIIAEGTPKKLKEIRWCRKLILEAPIMDKVEIKHQNIENLGTPPAFFSCWDMHSYYGESYIIHGVRMDIHEGEIVALLGRNGAGKTTILRSIARMNDPQVKHGELWLDHQPLHEMQSYQAAQHGVALVPEDRRIIAGLTLEENLQLAQIEEPHGWSLERIFDHFPRLGERRKQEAITLSGGEQQMLAIGRALARDIKLLLLDEPYEGLAPVIVQEIEKILLSIKSLGITTLIVEQNAIAALKLADRAIILDMGKIVFDGTAQEVMDNEDLRNEYLAI